MRPGARSRWKRSGAPATSRFVDRVGPASGRTGSGPRRTGIDDESRGDPVPDLAAAQRQCPARAAFAAAAAAVLAAAAVPWSDGPLRRLAGGEGDGPDPTFDVAARRTPLLRAAAPLVERLGVRDRVARRLAARTGEPQGGRAALLRPRAPGARAARAEWIFGVRDGRVVAIRRAMSLVAGVLVVNAAFLAAGYALLGPRALAPVLGGCRAARRRGRVGTLVFFATIVGLHASLRSRRWSRRPSSSVGSSSGDATRLEAPPGGGRPLDPLTAAAFGVIAAVVRRRRRRRLSLRAVARRRLGDLAAEGPGALAPRARRAALRAERRVRDVRRAGLPALVVGRHEPRRAGRRRPRRARRVRAARAADGRVRRRRRAAALGTASGRRVLAGSLAPARPLPRALAARPGRRRRPPARDLPRARRARGCAVAARRASRSCLVLAGLALAVALQIKTEALPKSRRSWWSERSLRGGCSGSALHFWPRCRGSRGDGCTTCRTAPSST